MRAFLLVFSLAFALAACGGKKSAPPASPAPPADPAPTGGEPTGGEGSGAGSDTPTTGADPCEGGESK